MTDEETLKPDQESSSSKSATPRVRRTQTHEHPTESDKAHSTARVYSSYQEANRWLRIVAKDFRRRLYRARFVLEVIGLIILGVYTYQAREANILTRRSMAVADRPWVGVGEVAITRQLARSVAMQVTVHFSNAGRSPALHLKPHVVLVPVAPGDTFDTIIFARDRNCSVPKPEWKDAKGGMLYLPGANNASFPVISSPLPDNQVDFLNGVPNASIEPLSGLGLWLVGCLDYFDQFHNAHRTYTCQFLVEGKNFSICPDGNDAD